MFDNQKRENMAIKDIFDINPSKRSFRPVRVSNHLFADDAKLYKHVLCDDDHN